MTTTDVLIVGAGLAGLTCARELHRRGIACRLLDASDRPGGRVKSDVVEGFTLDHGFQVLLTAYPECKAQLDYADLDLRTFYPGSLVYWNDQLHRLANPRRRPFAALRSAFSPIGSFGDKLRVNALRRAANAGTLEELYARPAKTSEDALRSLGFSTVMIEQFFRPFFGGVFLDRSLETSSRKLEFTFRMFASGDTAVPARGMGAIPAQLASQLPSGTLHCGVRVQSIRSDGSGVATADGEELRCKAVVIATDGTTAAELVPELDAPSWASTTTVYFAANRSPLREAILALDGHGHGPVNHLCVMSDVCPEYAPTGQSLISANVVDAASELPDHELLPKIRNQLGAWFDSQQAQSWRHLRTVRIPRALPIETRAGLDPVERPVTLGPGRFVCGDHRDMASIHGAMVSGRRTAEAVAASLSGRN